MPRSKPSDTIVYRIELGTKEREMIDGAIAAFQFNRVATPVVAGMSDVSFMIALGGLLAIYFPDIVLPTGQADAGEVIGAINTGIVAGFNRAEQERAATGESTLDDAGGIRDTLGRVWFNLTNPNWTFTDPNAPRPTLNPRTWGEVFD